jgi:hypothetical protein
LDQAAQQGLSHRQNLQRNVRSSVSCWNFNKTAFWSVFVQIMGQIH